MPPVDPTRLAIASLMGLTLAGCDPDPEVEDLYGVALTDADGDGYVAVSDGGDDCDDDDASVHPGADETAGDGVDSNCDGEDDT